MNYFLNYLLYFSIYLIYYVRTNYYNDFKYFFPKSNVNLSNYNKMLKHRRKIIFINIMACNV